LSQDPESDSQEFATGVDNDGQDEIVLALVLSVGPTIKTNSCLVTYKLTPQPQPPAQAPEK